MIDRAFWEGRRVFLTGHTGFKGGWLTLLLRSLGAQVFGFALPPDNENGIFTAAKGAEGIHHQIGDIRNFAELRASLGAARPDIVIHMAAQALVRLSYAEPIETYATNVMGTVHLLEAARQTPGVKAVVIITSDKCYENVGWLWGYRETDHLGGHDPYSNSKGCAELVTDGYRRSFFSTEGAACVASGRAGNVIGGGDWSKDRLVPDAIRAFMAGEALRIRNPASVRPWQHVLDPVLGYLVLAERLVKDGRGFAEGWNLGPSAASEVPVRRVVDGLVKLWGGQARWEADGGQHPHEAAYLKLDCSKALARLGWHPLLDLDEALRLTAEWYQAFAAGADMQALTAAQINLVLERGNAARAAAAAASA